MNRAKFANNAEISRGHAGADSWWRRYIASLRYSLHVITHPFDGFWDLVHEKRGSLAAAHTFLALFLITYVPFFSTFHNTGIDFLHQHLFINRAHRFSCFRIHRFRYSIRK